LKEGNQKTSTRLGDLDSGAVVVWETQEAGGVLAVASGRVGLADIVTVLVGDVRVGGVGFPDDTRGVETRGGGWADRGGNVARRSGETVCANADPSGAGLVAAVSANAVNAKLTTRGRAVISLPPNEAVAVHVAVDPAVHASRGSVVNSSAVSTSEASLAQASTSWACGVRAPSTVHAVTNLATGGSAVITHPAIEADTFVVAVHPTVAGAWTSHSHRSSAISFAPTGEAHTDTSRAIFV